MTAVKTPSMKAASMKGAPTLEQVLKRPCPSHIAIIMDGNGRWAERRGLPRLMGHRAGRRAVREVVEGAVELKIRVLTLYTFSLENWDRGAREVSGLMRILEQVLREERAELKRNNVQLRTSGELRVSNFLLWQLAYAEFWVTDVLWPDFRRKHLYQAVYDFQRRSRRFGRTR